MPIRARVPTPDAGAFRERSGEAILTVEALRTLERLHATLPLMERAGTAAADAAGQRLHERRGRVTVLAGPGNNGGDACVVARLLHERGYAVEVLGRPPTGRASVDTEAAWKAMRAAGVREIEAPPRQNPALVVDGLFGIGLARSIGEPWAAWIRWANDTGAPIVALDVPSGLDAATGVAYAPVIAATHTATFIALKPGLVTGDGPDCCGTISVHDLGVDGIDAARSGTWLTWPPSRARFPEILLRRRRATHKGTFGTVVVAGGAEGMVGAALLAGRAALALGAGRVVVEILARGAPHVDPVAPELMLNATRLRSSRRPSPATDTQRGAAHGEWTAIDAQAYVVGPGIGLGTLAKDVLVSAIARKAPLVLDADALNLVARDAGVAAAIATRTAETLLTPHPAEAARLLASDTASVQSDRVAAATALASKFRATVVLKGAGSIVAHPASGFDINATGNPALSTAGAGDVLSGILGALLAQGIAAADAARFAVCVHGAAADALVADGVGPLGVRASEVIERARTLVNDAARREP